MNSRDITIIILLLIVLAVLYKIMQASKLQTELATGMAKKMGVEIKKPQPRREIEEETEDAEHEEQEEEEEQEDENEEQEEEVEVQEEDSHGKRIGSSKAIVLKVAKPKKEKKEKKEKKPKMKAYEQMANIFTDAPLQSGEMMERYINEFGNVSSNEFWLTLNYAIKKGLVKKYQYSETPKKNIYGTPEMFDGDELKEEHKENLPK